MIKVLAKTFAILEEIVIASPKPVSLGKLAEKLDLNKATCSRIIGDLVDAGYLVQKSRHEGYVAGPRAYAFGEQVSYKEPIVREAKTIIKACAEKIGESVLMAEMHNLSRYILCHYNYNRTLNVVIDYLSINDLYTTATGAMSLAYASDQEIDEIVKRDGLPCGLTLWKEVNSREDFDRARQKIRDNKCLIYGGPRENRLAIVAFPVFQNGRYIAVVGASVPQNSFHGKHKDEVIKEVKAATDKLNQRISHIASIG